MPTNKPVAVPLFLLIVAFALFLPTATSARSGQTTDATAIQTDHSIPQNMICRRCVVWETDTYQLPDGSWVVHSYCTQWQEYICGTDIIDMPMP
jgi:hypothetical protein